MNYKDLTSPEAVERAKQQTIHELKEATESAGNRLKYSFLPEDTSYVKSENQFVRYVGYGITVVKTANTVRKIVNFIRRKVSSDKG